VGAGAGATVQSAAACRDGSRSCLLVAWMLAGALIGAELGFTGDGAADALLGAFAGAVLWTFMFSVLRLVLGLRMLRRRAIR
jgi:hypothetical protein